MKKRKKLVYFSIIATIILGVYITSVNANSDIKMKKNITLIDNTTKELTFIERYSSGDKNQIHVYEDDKKNDYYYKNDKLVAYINEDYYSSEKVKERESQESVEKLNESNIQNVKNISKLDSIAEKYLDYFAPRETRKTDNDYELISKTFLDATDEYSYFYAKKIDGYLVNDGILISLDVEGNLITYSGAQQGYYDDYTNIKIDEEKVNNFIIKEANKLGIEEYEVVKEYINLVDGELVLQIVIKVIHETGAFSTKVLYYNL